MTFVNPNLIYPRRLGDRDGDRDECLQESNFAHVHRSIREVPTALHSTPLADF